MTVMLTLTRARPVNRSPYGHDPAFDQERTVTVAANAVTAILSTRDADVSIIRLLDGRQGIRVAASVASIRNAMDVVDEDHRTVPTSQPVNPTPMAPTLVPTATVDPDASDDID